MPLAQISDRESFHDVFARVLGFPQYYARNMDAWVELVSTIDTASATAIQVGRKGVLTLALDGAEGFRVEHPDLWDELIDSAGSVNFRRIVRGEPAVVALAYQ